MALKYPSDKSKLFITRLGNESASVLKKFKCENTDFEQFLHRKAKKHEENLIAKTYLLYYEKDDVNEIVGFYTLSTASITATEELRLSFKNGKKYNDYPSVRIGRLAISKDYEKRGFAGYLLDYIKQQILYSDLMGCRYVIVDAINEKSELYLKNGFSYYTEKDKSEKTRLMYYDLIELLP